MTIKLLMPKHRGGRLEPETVKKYARKYSGGIVFFENGDYFVNYIPKTGSLFTTKKIPRCIWQHRMSTPRKRKAIARRFSNRV